MSRRHIRLLAVFAQLSIVSVASADEVVKIGVLTDLSGPYAALAGQGSVAATKMAVDDCLAAECRGMRIEVLSADHGNKPDIGAAIARRWFDQEGVTTLVDVINGGVQAAIQPIVREKNRMVLYAGGPSRITNEDCAPQNSVMWMYDTYSQVAATVGPMSKPGSRWFFLTVNYAFGHSLQADATDILKRKGGEAVGSARHPFGTSDFSSFLLQAQSSGADFIGLANAGSDAVIAAKQAAEYGITTSQKVVAFVMLLPDVKSLGLKLAGGITLAEGFYWDLDDKTRAFSSRFEAITKQKPSMAQAGAYSATLHYLRAIAAAKSTDPKTVVEKMRELPIRDDVVRNASLRKDGRMVHDYYQFQVKSPAESKGPDDLYILRATIPAAEAFKPISESTCPLLEK